MSEITAEMTAATAIPASNRVATWTEGPDTLLLLKGKGLLQQGVVQARFERAVVRIDMARLRATRVLHALVYAEGPDDDRAWTLAHEYAARLERLQAS